MFLFEEGDTGDDGLCKLARRDCEDIDLCGDLEGIGRLRGLEGIERLRGLEGIGRLLAGIPPLLLGLGFSYFLCLRRHIYTL